MISSWIVPYKLRSEKAVGAVRSLRERRFKEAHGILLQVGLNYNEACNARDKLGLDFACCAGSVHALFARFQKHRRHLAGKECHLFVVIDPGDAPNLVSPAFNRMFKDTNVSLVVLSDLPCLVRDHRFLHTLSGEEEDYEDVDDTQDISAAQNPQAGRGGGWFTWLG